VKRGAEGLEKRGIGLLSGGLDSTLAVRIMLDLGIEVIGLNFMSPFCTCTSKNSGCKSEAVKVARASGIDIRSIFLGQEYLDMIRAPKHGYGKNMNPCMDCRIMMFRYTKGIMKEVNASFIFTGEVLGQRPMSQRHDAMNIIDKESGVKGLVLRPLSARLLEPTIPEKEGVVNRERLLRISGRSRRPQIRMAEEYNINDYHCPSGGCLLTQISFANRMRDMIKFSHTISVKDARLLRIGRHFRLTEKCKVIVGRNKEENDKLEKVAEPDDYSFFVKGYTGPVVIAKGVMEESLIPLISQITARYGDTPKNADVPVCWKRISNNEGSTILVTAIDEVRLKEMRI